MHSARAFAALDARTPLGPFTVERRDPGPRDVQFDVLYCGVCHSDLHTARSEWAGTRYPCVPGHEITGRVTAVGGDVRLFGVGDRVAVGCLVDSCRACGNCRAGLEQFCDNHQTTWTYNSDDRKLPGRWTYGGYSTSMVVDEHFCLRVPNVLDLAKTAPLLCAGITTYSPLRHWNVREGKRVGIVGLGGLGHMGLKLAVAMGAECVVFTTSSRKRDDALRFGAHDVVLADDDAARKKYAERFDMILDTVSASHDLDVYTSLLARDGSLVLVGVPERPHPSPSAGKLIARRRSISGSSVGGIPETQEMLDFCAEHSVMPEIELIPIQRINEAYERMLRGDVRYRFVIDMASLTA